MGKNNTIFKTLLLSVLLSVGLSFSVFAFARADAHTVENVDFYSANAAVTATVKGSADTEIVLPYGDGHIVFGENENNPYFVSMAYFNWKINLTQIEVGQSFAVSFLKDASAMPFTENAVGVSYVFRLVSENSFHVYAVDAKDGTTIKEMEESQSPWAYLEDGTFSDVADTDATIENYSNGMLGYLNTADIANTEFMIKNEVDGASFGGTTFRPKTAMNELGATIDGNIFTVRGMDITKTVLVLSAGSPVDADGVSDSDLKFTAGALNDKATKSYNISTSRMKIVNDLYDWNIDAQDALNGTLSEENYKTLTEGLENLDLSVLRVRDRYELNKSLETIRQKLSALNDKTANVAKAVTDYGDSLNALSDLILIDGEKIEAAKSTKKTYDEYSAYVKYLDSAERQAIQQLMDTFDQTLLTRAELHIDIVAYEESVAAFSTPVFDTSAEVIYAAETARAGIATDKLSQLSVDDKVAFEQRISVADSALAAARAVNAYDVEYHKIKLYEQAVNALGNSVKLTDFNDVIKTRPQLKLSDVPDETSKSALNKALSAADSAFGTHLLRLLESWENAYMQKTYLLGDTLTLSQSKIDDAKSAAYVADDLSFVKNVAEKINCDITARVANLEECDRVVNAAEIRLLLVDFKNATASLTDIGSIKSAYDKYVIVNAADTSVLSETELTDFDSILASAVTVYETAVKAYTEPLLKAFENAVAVSDIAETEAVRAAASARNAVPSLDYMVVTEDAVAYKARYDVANAVLLNQPLYYAYATGSSWSLINSDGKLKINNDLTNGSDGVAAFTDPLDIDGFDFAFEFTEIGRIWKGEDPAGSGKYPQNVPMLHIMREPEKVKDHSMGFSVYFKPNHVNQLEISVYGPDGNSPLASGNLENCGFTAQPYAPFTVRVRIEVASNCYRLYINNLQLNIYYRDFINPDDTKNYHLSDYQVGEEVGEYIFKDGKAYFNFSQYGESLSANEVKSSLTVLMIGDKTFGDYVAPVYTKSVQLVAGPNKTVYEKGEKFDKAGIVMTATLSDGSTITVPLNDIKVFGFTSTSKGKKNVTLSYTDGSGVTLGKVIQVEIVEPAAEQHSGGCEGSILDIGLTAFVLLTLAAILVLKRRQKTR